MNYVVLSITKKADGTYNNDASRYDNINKAYQKFYTLMAWVAGTTDIASGAVAIIDEKGVMIEHKWMESLGAK